MRILHIIDTLQIGGAERVLVDLCNILVQRKHDVTVLILTNGNQLGIYLDPVIPVLNLNRTNKWSVEAFYKVYRICRNYDIVHVHMRHNFRYVALAKYIFNGKHNLILHDHYGDIENDQSVPFLLDFLLKRNHYFIGVSQSLVDWAIDRISLSPSECFLLSNIVVKKNVSVGTRQFNGIVKILMVGNFRLSKNYIFAIRLLKSLTSIIPFQATLIGQVGDAQYVQMIKDEIHLNDLNDKIEICYDCNDIQSILGGYDLALHTAHQESGPLVLIEYLAQGLPFVAYKTGEVSAQLDKYLPELFLNNFEISDWIDHIKHVINNRDSFVSKMSPIYGELYDIGVYYEKVMAIYRKVVSSL